MPTSKHCQNGSGEAQRVARQHRHRGRSGAQVGPREAGHAQVRRQVAHAVNGRIVTLKYCQQEIQGKLQALETNKGCFTCEHTLHHAGVEEIQG